MGTNVRKRTIADEIDHVVDELSQLSASSPQYEAASKNLAILCEAHRQKQTLSMDTLVIAGTNILGILLVLNYEKLNVVTSKAVGLLLRGRL